MRIRIVSLVFFNFYYVSLMLTSPNIEILWSDNGNSLNDWIHSGSVSVITSSNNCPDYDHCFRLRAPDHSDETNAGEIYIDTVNTLGFYNISIQFSMKGNSLNSCVVKYRIGNGIFNYWRTLWTGDGDIDTTRMEGISDSADNSDSVVWIRFENNDSRDSCYIDDVYLYGTPITPSPTRIPTYRPTGNTEYPSNIPTIIPTTTPSDVPTIYPTDEPSINPSNSPSNMPTITPTKTPTDIPTKMPTIDPTTTPTNIPSVAPTIFPTHVPTAFPTDLPTLDPTYSPLTLDPTGLPTMTPINLETYIPTNNPSKAPTLLSEFMINNNELSSDISKLIVPMTVIGLTIVLFASITTCMFYYRKVKKLEHKKAAIKTGIKILKQMRSASASIAAHIAAQQSKPPGSPSIAVSPSIACHIGRQKERPLPLPVSPVSLRLPIPSLPPLPPIITATELTRKRDNSQLSPSTDNDIEIITGSPKAYDINNESSVEGCISDVIPTKGIQFDNECERKKSYASDFDNEYSK